MRNGCRVCGGAIESGGGPGRAASYCSQACRQRAYRERLQPAGVPVRELITDIGNRLRRLRPDPALAFYADVEALSTRFAQLRRGGRPGRGATSRPVGMTGGGPKGTGGVTAHGGGEIKEGRLTALLEEEQGGRPGRS